jgi:hypothetical protein
MLKGPRAIRALGNRRIKKAAHPVVWKGAGERSPALDPIA